MHFHDVNEARSQAMHRAGLHLIPVLAATVAVFVGVAPVASAGESINPNLVVNSQANAGLEGWSSTGWSVVTYGSSPSVPPASTFGVFSGAQPNLFEAQRAGATLTQDISFAGYVSKIEAGSEPVWVSVLLGGAGAYDRGAELLAQPQGETGQPLGPPTQLGPPTAADREDGTGFIECRDQFTAPVGMRSLLLTIEATGVPGQRSVATADAVNAGPGPLLMAFSIDGERRAEAPNCYVHVTRAEMLEQALRHCRKDERGKKRVNCDTHARKTYGPPSNGIAAVPQRDEDYP